MLLILPKIKFCQACVETFINQVIKKKKYGRRIPHSGSHLIFFNDLGLYDVLLPFLLVFVLVFAMLEKTKVLGTEKVGNEHVAKKPLNAIIAFTMAFFVVASVQLVNIVHEVLATAALLLIAGTLLLLFLGIFKTTAQNDQEEKNTFVKVAFTATATLATFAIFLNTVERENGDTWLEFLLSSASGQNVAGGTSSVFASVILIGIAIGAIWWVSRGDKPPKAKDTTTPTL